MMRMSNGVEAGLVMPAPIAGVTGLVSAPLPLGEGDTKSNDTKVTSREDWSNSWCHVVRAEWYFSTFP